jgi:predicted nucleotidyltransferase
VTPVRSIPPDFDPTVVSAIDQRLEKIAAEQNVAILWAVESGSRAWGFPSPDSDYDCRFIFVRPLEEYLSVSPRRDVIEVPIEEGLDICGWDLFKMAKLLLKGNAAVLEWLSSPIIYRGLAEFREDWHILSTRLVDRLDLSRHYYHLGQGQRRKHLAGPEQVALKKLFCVLRPAAALRWLRLHPEGALPPMHFPSLLDETQIPFDVMNDISALLTEKARSRELGQGSAPKSIAAFVDAEYECAQARIEAAGSRASRSGATLQADRLVQHWIAAAQIRTDPESAVPGLGI